MTEPFNSYFNLEAEKCLIGCAMNNQQALNQIVNLRQDAFYAEQHRILFQCICALEKANRDVDLVTVNDWLTKNNLVKQAGGLDYLIDCTQSGFSTNARSYIKIIHECAMNRSLYNLGRQLMQKTNGGNDPNEVREWAARQIKEVRLGDSVRLIDMQEACQNTYSALEEDQKGEEGSDMSKCIETGIEDLDRVIGHLRGGMYVAIGARPSVGKSILALSFCVNAAKKGKRVLLVSLEMNEVEITERILANESNVSLGMITSGHITSEAWGNMAHAIGKIANLPLYYSLEAETVEKVRMAAYQLYENDGLDMIAIDYLQLMESSYSRKNGRQEQVSEISRGLKRLAQEMQIPILVLTQLNRASEKTTNQGKKTKREPTMSEARESGAIEQDANIFILLHDPQESELEGEYEKDAFEKTKAYRMTMIRLIVDKNRQGKRGRVTVAFDGNHMRFIPIRKIGETNDSKSNADETHRRD